MCAMINTPDNQRAFRRLQAEIDHRFPKGRFVAIDRGEIVADAATFGDLDTLLVRLKLQPRNVLVVQAGEEYPESATIFL